MPNSSNPILVTGATGFLAKHCILLLLEKGCRVRGTIRSLEKETTLRETLKPFTDKLDRLELFEADLTADDGWDQAVSGCDQILHVASPFPLHAPAHEDELIIPAREGTLRVIKAASKHSAKRVVLTSSVAAIAGGYTDKIRTFSEKDWSLLDGNIGAYQKSKTIAEKAAWDYISGLDGENSLELVSINPGFIIGPVLDDAPRTSNELHLKLMRREYPGAAKITFNLVDVRDVAQAHYLALTTPEAAGERFICVTATVWMSEVASILDRRFREDGYKIPTRTIPEALVRLVAVFDKTARGNLGSLGRVFSYDTAKIRETLRWQPRPHEESIIEMGESLIDVGLV